MMAYIKVNWMLYILFICHLVLGYKVQETFSLKSDGNNSCNVIPPTQEPLKMLVPLYMYPGSSWDLVASAASKIDIIGIVNPDSGPLPSPDSTYITYMSKLNSSGVIQIGYVHTSYGTRNITVVKGEVDTYVTKYPHLSGIFFDEASASAKDIPYFTQLYAYVLKLGFVHVILNPGTQPDQGYLAISTSIVVFENVGSDVESTTFSSWVTCAPNEAEKATYKYKFSGIAHNTLATNSSAYITSFQNKGLGLVFTTDGSDYNNLVSYFANEVSSIQAMNN